mmetsp:Transcript_25269/g.84338  ORF Transcript_25269/g.84338 Transcript_25269/m.84338 type:complete len:1908 (+) Transcript_25269:100-5823(+)
MLPPAVAEASDASSIGEAVGEQASEVVQAEAFYEPADAEPHGDSEGSGGAAFEVAEALDDAEMPGCIGQEGPAVVAWQANVHAALGRICELLEIPATSSSEALEVELNDLRSACGSGASQEQLGALLLPPNVNGELLLRLGQIPPASNSATTAALTWLLAAGANPNVKNPSGETPLTLAVRSFSLHCGAEVIGALLEARADPNTSDSQGETPLMEAACMGDVGLCRLLLHAKADPAQTSSLGMAPFHFAEHPEVSALFTGCLGEPGDEEHEGGEEAEQFGINTGNRAETSHYNISSEVNSAHSSDPTDGPDDVDGSLPPEEQDWNDLTLDPPADLLLGEAGSAASEWASRHRSSGDAEAASASVEALVGELQVKVCDHDPDGTLQILKELQERSVSVDGLLEAHDADGNGLLHLSMKAVTEKSNWVKTAETVQLLTFHKSDPNARNFLGETPLMLAIRTMALNVGSDLHRCAAPPLRALLEARADPDAGDDQNETALMEAACICSIDFCKILIEARASVLHMSQSNLTAVDFADDAEILALFKGEIDKAMAKVPVSVQSAAHPTPDLVDVNSSKENGCFPPGTSTTHSDEDQEHAFSAPSLGRTCCKAGICCEDERHTNVPLSSGRGRQDQSSMSYFLAKAHRAPTAQVATRPQDSAIDHFDMSIAASLIDAVVAHQPSFVQELLADLDTRTDKKPRQQIAKQPSSSADSVLRCRDLDGHTLLHLCLLAPRLGRLDHVTRTVGVLLVARADVNAPNLSSETPLLLAIREAACGCPGEAKASFELIAALLDHNADANLADSSQTTPLHEAVAIGHDSLIDLLIAHGASPFLRGGPTRRTAFEHMCDTKPSLVASMAEKFSVEGCDSHPTINEQDGGKRGPTIAAPSPARCIGLMEGAVQGHSAIAVKEVATMWCEAGSPLSELAGRIDADGNGWLHLCMLTPPLDLSCDDKIALVRTLLDMRVELDLPNSRGETPLWLAVGASSGGNEGHVELIRLLIHARASLDGASSAGGRTPLAEAAKNGDAHICRILLEARADIHARDAIGWASIDLLSASQPEILNVVRSLGQADVANASRHKEGIAVSRQAKLTLRDAVMLQDSGKVNELLGNGAIRGAERDADGHTMLHLCLISPLSEKGLMAKLDTLIALLRGGADPNIANHIGEPPLLMAVREASWYSCLDMPLFAVIVGALLNANADFEASDLQGCTPLTEACRQDSAELVAALIDAGASMSCPAKNGRIANELVLPRGAVARLLSHRAASTGKPNHPQTNRLNSRPLTAEHGSLARRAHMLVSTVQAHDASSLCQIIESFTRQGKKAAEMLNVQDIDGHSFLHLCILSPRDHSDKSRLPETIKVLLAGNADASLVNNAGETPLLLGVRELAGSGCEARLLVARSLMKAGSGIDVGDAQDTTPLMEAALIGDAEICELLLDRGADMHRRGGSGHSALELAAQHPAVCKIFDAQIDRRDDGVDGAARGDQSALQLVDVVLRHVLTGLERTVVVPKSSSIRDVKKTIVRLTRRGSWRRIALLTEDGRMLHDNDMLKDRDVLIIADAKSPQARNAAEHLLSDEERWQRLSLEELQVEAVQNQGVYGGEDRDTIIASLTEVKRWIALPAKDLWGECSKRHLAIDTNPDKEELLSQLKQDFSWENMLGAALRLECLGCGIPLPEDTTEPAFSRAMRSRLRQAKRWERLPVEQLSRACELRNFEIQRASRGEMLAFLKSFRVLPKPQPAVTRPAAAQPVAAKPACSKQTRKTARAFPGSRTTFDGSEGESIDDESKQLPRHLSQRVQRLCRKYPQFSGGFPIEMNDWSDKDIEMYLYSNGFLKPNSTRKAQVVPKAVISGHYEMLGLPEGSPATEVRKAYRRLALIYHPDKNLDNSGESTDRFKSITEAYDVLSSHLTASEPAG